MTPPPFWRRLAYSAANVAGWTSVFVFLLDHVGSVAAVDGRSMQPTLNPDSNGLARDLLLLNKRVLGHQHWRRGDVVTLRSPINPETVVAKRILALEDDFVISDPRSRFVGRSGMVPGQSSPRAIWIEGDAGMHSRDSNEYGPVPLGLLTARVAAIVWPPERVAWVERHERASSRTAVVTREAVRGAGGTVVF
ncbi:peptidase S24/S26A/S26B/S26C [Blastocladiella britannica]|nr:peptidase S24/S26A/S26B/S26C [Blastocladiella britannica]